MANPQSEPQTPPLAPWQKGLAGLAVATGVVGVGLVVYSMTGGDAETASDTADNLRSGLIAGSSDAGDSTRDAARAWGDHLWRGALAFVLAFCVGTALRKSLRAAIVVAGFGILVLLGLHLGGLYEVDWSAVGARAADVAEQAKERAGDAIENTSLYLGSVIAGAVGLVVGFVRA